MAITTAPGALTAAVRLIGTSTHVVVDHARSGGDRDEDERAHELDDHPDPQWPVAQRVLLEPDEVSLPDEIGRLLGSPRSGIHWPERRPTRDPLFVVLVRR
jgi:hypothetical protein